ncbi:MAG: hydroxyethylthiazole kinase [Truepera sp.]|nr:hydroxyethylthiazole kinase [Truepera sp.]MBS3967799.1 hydroxyethylthiazole kinase [Truepera sp.]
MDNFGERAAVAFERLRQQKPLLHHITNLVVMNDTANLTLHLGALPVMAHALEEVEEMVRLAGALVLNPGTLDPNWIASMLLAGQAAQARNIPIVLDPVGAGATRLRTETNRQLLQELKIAIVRGNAGEIGALAGAGGEVKGVESVGGPEDVAGVARQAARAWGSVVAVTGQRDIVSDGQRLLVVDNGHSWLTSLTGTGCMATTTVAAFAAVEQDALLAAAGALATFGLAAELAAVHAAGPASFKAVLFDQLYHLTPAQVKAGARISRLERS